MTIANCSTIFTTWHFAVLAQQQDGKDDKQPEKSKSTKKPDRGGRRKAPRAEKPPVPLPNGPKGETNEWVPVPGTQNNDYGPRYTPKFPVAGGKSGAQPNAWWDPDDGYWSVEPGNGGSRGHYDDWGNKVSMTAVWAAELAGVLAVLNELDEATGP